MDYKLLVLDIDGTLTNSKKEITPRVFDALKKAQEKGVKIREALDEKPVLLRWAVYLLGFAAVLIFGIYGPGYDASAFIYRGF